MRIFIATIAFLLTASAATAAETKKVYTWTDDEGNVHYSDSIPAEYAERPKDVLNEHAVKIDELEGKKTPEQLEAERLENERRVAQELQKRQDQALLATYLSVDEIMMHRDRRVELFQAQSRVTELFLRNQKRRLDSLRDRASRYRPYSEDDDAPMIDEALAADLRATRETIERHERNLEKYKLDEQKIIERFDGDIERFKLLKGVSATSASASS
ncbi:MAG: DUF4124 domain-containing protein [Woeseiaceae bacterium]|nr:DUF4124 domain-containing protein [Woeseiaceae bacterium]